MIVKNESSILTRCLDSVLPLIDYIYISDTGSSDNSEEIAKKWIENRKIKGVVERCEWVNFGYNRTHAIERSKVLFNADYTLVIDADEILEFSDLFDITNTKDSLNKDLYSIVCKYGGIEYLRPNLFTNSKKFYYKGALHEFLECQEKVESSGILEGVFNIPIQDSNRNKNSDKYEDDAALLEEVIKNNKDESLTQRYYFYLAQSYRDSNNFKKAIENYLKVLDLNGYVQEKYCSCLYIGRLYNYLEEKEKALFYFLKGIEYDSSRIETIALASNLLRELNNHTLVCLLYDSYKGYSKNNNNILFKETELYKNYLEFNFSISAYYVGRKKEGKKILKNLLADSETSYILMEQAKKNSVFYDL